MIGKQMRLFHQPEMVLRRFFLLLLPILLWIGGLPHAFAATGTITIPYLSSQPDKQQPFAGHPGWVDIYTGGYSTGVSARIGPDGKFELPEPAKPVSLIAMFDKIETPPIILPRWPIEPGNYDVPITTEYACVPPGYPDVWDKEYTTRATNFFQKITAKGSQLYGVSVFDGTKMADFGNQIHISVRAGTPQGEVLPVRDERVPDPMAGGYWDMMTAARSHRELPRAGWRHGNMELIPGWPYCIEVSGYRSHSGKNFELDAYIRPDKGDGYPDGEAWADDKATGGDLCILVFTDCNGQIVENQIRTEEWETFLPKHRPTKQWGQTFTNHGASLAGVSFWASSGDTVPMTCEVFLREEGPWGREIKPARNAISHESPSRPIVRYPDCPSPLEEYKHYYDKPCHFFQVAYAPGEARLEKGKTYYIELRPSKPVLVFADGDYYQQGYAFYEGLKVDRQVTGQATLHSARWTLAMNIVTYKE